MDRYIANVRTHENWSRRRLGNYGFNYDDGGGAICKVSPHQQGDLVFENDVVYVYVLG